MAGFAAALVALDGWQWQWPMLGEWTVGFAAVLVPFGWVAVAVADAGGVEVAGLAATLVALVTAFEVVAMFVFLLFGG